MLTILNQPRNSYCCNKKSWNSTNLANYKPEPEKSATRNRNVLPLRGQVLWALHRGLEFNSGFCTGWYYPRAASNSLTFACNPSMSDRLHTRGGCRFQYVKCSLTAILISGVEFQVIIRGFPEPSGTWQLKSGKRSVALWEAADVTGRSIKR